MLESMTSSKFKYTQPTLSILPSPNFWSIISIFLRVYALQEGISLRETLQFTVFPCDDDDDCAISRVEIDWKILCHWVELEIVCSDV